MTDIIQPSLGLIDTTQLKVDELFLFPIHYEMFAADGDVVGAYIKSQYFVIHTKSWNPLKKIWCYEQEEFPLESLPWIIERFENFYWSNKPATLDEYSQDVIFSGERIGINTMMHCCAENVFGYKIWNASRVSYIARGFKHEWEIPRYMLQDQGIFEKLKEVADKYKTGYFNQAPSP